MMIVTASAAAQSTADDDLPDDAPGSDDPDTGTRAD